MKKIIATSVAASLLILSAIVLYANNAHTTEDSSQILASPKANKVMSIEEHGTYAMYTLEDLVNEADLIVKGSVESVSEPRWNNKDNRKPDAIGGEDTIYKDTVFKVDKLYKGVAESDTVKVRSFGGRTADFEIISDMELKLKIGDEAIVFLVPDNTIYNKEKATGHYILLGALQGLYNVNGDDVSNVHASMTMAELEQEIKNYMGNPQQTEKTGGPSAE